MGLRVKIALIIIGIIWRYCWKHNIKRRKVLSLEREVTCTTILENVKKC